MSRQPRLLTSGTVWPATVTRHSEALAGGAIRPIATSQTFVEDAGVRFLVRQAAALARKEAARKTAARQPPANPFLPWEPALFVGGISPTHIALLNKFSVIDCHLLIVTRVFEHQETLLQREDFQALAQCMADVDGLAFYNGGSVAGASQPHKHLQLVPLPLVEQGEAVPIEAAFSAAEALGGVASLPALPFRHAFASLDPARFDDPTGAAEALYSVYREMCAEVGVADRVAHPNSRQAVPYNLLLTRRWMLLVVRSAERWGDISINALGFAGSLFVRSATQMKTIANAGPMSVLRGVTVPGR
jgi:sulfate adenylyltransferase (ADP) / ATP adenylyltransferase